MAKSITDKLANKRAALITRTALALGVSEPEAINLLQIERRQSIRFNHLKPQPNDYTAQMQALGWSGAQYPWYPDGYSVDADMKTLRDSELVESGALYIQNAASWLPVLALNPQPGQTILDVCAAPGGKTSHIAALTNNQASITANDNSRARLAKLRSNLQRLGVSDVEFTLYDATQLARKLEGRMFDSILLDAPCSGEGMLSLSSDKDMATWSVAHIKRLQQLQKRLITQAWQLLRPGGTLVYSTCTMAPEENECIIDYLLRKTDDARIVEIPINPPNRYRSVVAWNSRQLHHDVACTLRLAPSFQIEAFFVAKITKNGTSSR